MMAKMFYTLEETKTALAKTEEDIRQFARDGRLREFRDGPRLMFKADQVDQLRGDLAGGIHRSDLGGSDSGAAIGMQDIGASGSGVISLADTDFGKSPGAGMVKDDTALAADLGLSGSMGGVPSPIRGSGSTAGSRAGGITVFDVDDAHKPDPLAQTAIGSGIQDQVNLEGVGSGSGLLDLTRESDDTSLGAELIDEFGTGGSGLAGSAVGATLRRPAQGDSGVGMDQLSGGVVNRSRLAAPVYVEAADSWALAFGCLALFGAIVVLFGGFVVVNAVMGVHPEVVHTLTHTTATGESAKGMIYLVGAGVLAVVLFVLGWVGGKVGSR